MALPIVTAEEMGRVDARAIEKFGIPSAALMETAGGGAAQIIWERFGKPGLRVLVMAGKGKNGGDGFVIARHLLNRGATVRVIAIPPSREASGDPAVFLSVLKKMGVCVEEARGEESKFAIAAAAKQCDVIVDALLGTGFSPPARGFLREALSALSGVDSPIVALDIPSGIDATSGMAESPFLRAELTVTFGALKRGHYLMSGAKFKGEVHLVDIGIPASCLEEENIPLRLIQESDVARFLPVRPVDIHKGNAGHFLVLAGSKGMMGAAFLAASAGLRMGAGKVTLAVPGSLSFAVESGPSEIMALSLPETSAGTPDPSAFDLILESAQRKDALLLGPGLSSHPRTVELIHRLIQHIEIPLLLDADGLNALSQDITALEGAPPGLVLTPHPGEMARLCQISIAEVQSDRINIAIDFAVRHNVNLALKGAHTIIALSDGSAWLNPTGSPNLASGGTGDVLAGVVGGLLTQGVAPEGALVAGTYLHGLAGDILAESMGDAGLAATDLLPTLPLARRRVLHKE